ncbi:MAG: hypothetical protein FWC68_04475 [Oscillospiraceae bacterium]|nr:hypothetical protein [Oscillospiraceae bacterium]
MKNKNTIIIITIAISIIALGAFFLINSITGESSNNSDSNESTANDSRMIRIRENMFKTQVNDVHMNISRYQGRGITLEGFLAKDTQGDENLYAIARGAPDCCGVDGLVGFLIEYEGEMPNEDEWIEVVGVLEARTTNQRQMYTVIRVEEITVKDVRGLEFVER